MFSHLWYFLPFVYTGALVANPGRNGSHSLISGNFVTDLTFWALQPSVGSKATFYPVHVSVYDTWRFSSTSDFMKTS